VIAEVIAAIVTPEDAAFVVIALVIAAIVTPDDAAFVVIDDVIAGIVTVAGAALLVIALVISARLGPDAGIGNTSIPIFYLLMKFLHQKYGN
jgi:hypothetical protein